MYSSRDIQSVRLLLQVSDADNPAGSDWSQDDLKSMLRHCMAGPISSFLASDEAGENPQATLNPLLEHPSIASINDLLERPNPPLDLLNAIKSHAKRFLAAKPPPVPPIISSVIYYAVILCARLKLDRSISNLPDPRILEGVEELLRIPWLPTSVQGLMRDFQARFAAPPPRTPPGG